MTPSLQSTGMPSSGEEKPEEKISGKSKVMDNFFFLSSFSHKFIYLLNFLFTVMFAMF